MRGILTSEENLTPAAIAKIENSNSEFLELKSDTKGRKPSEVAYNEIVGFMKKRYDAKINLLTERHKFLSRIQKSGEPLSEYISNLNLLAQECKWVCPSDECKTSIDFQAQFIRGLRDTNLREKFLQKKSDTKLEETLDAGLAFEAAHKQNTEDNRK